MLSLTQMAKPVPGDGEILVRVRATTVNRTDCATIRAKPFFMRLVTGLFKPRKPVPGSEFAGVVEDICSGVTSFEKGHRVFGFDDEGACAHAEFLTIREDKAITIPEGISFSQAAASSEGAHYAYNFINKVDLKEGHEVLVNGASGAIGSAAVQLLRSFGARVTAVCGTENVELVQSLGADEVIDYSRRDFTTDGKRYNYVFDTVGKSSFFKCMKSLKPGGVYISSDLGFLAQNLYLPAITPVIQFLFGRRKTAFPYPADIQRTLALVSNLMQSGQFKAVIDREYTLDEIIDAYRYVEKGYKTGNVVVTVPE